MTEVKRHLPIVDLRHGYRAINARADEQVAALVRLAEDRSGQRSPCARGCAACCRQPVALELGEAVAMIAAVRALPVRKRRALKVRLAAWLRAMERAGIDPRDPFGKPGAYFSANVACPLLVNEQCSIYQDRPMVCRSHVVLGDASRCKTHGGTEDTVNVLELIEMAVDAAISLTGVRPPVVNRLGWWLIGSWSLVMDKAEPDYLAWMVKVSARARPAAVVPSSAMDRGNDPAVMRSSCEGRLPASEPLADDARAEAIDAETPRARGMHRRE